MAMAFLNIINNWDDRYQVGRSYRLNRRLVTDTLQAVAMSASWFEHRAINVNANGSRDIGLSGIRLRSPSDSQAACRRDDRFCAQRRQYDDPLKAARMLTG